MEIEVGGQIQGISLGSFLQIVHMDKTSCTLKIYSNDDVGYLYLTDGALIAAEAGELNGLEAAYEIMSWNKTVIIIDNAPAPEKTISTPLMSILMEGLRRKDERNAQLESDEDARTEIQVDFDPDTYVSKDDEIASQFVDGAAASDKTTSGGDIELDYGDEPPPEPSAEPEEDVEGLVEQSAPGYDTERLDDKAYDVADKPVDDKGEDDDVEFEGEDAVLPEKTVKGKIKRLFFIAVVLSAATFAGLYFYRISLLKKNYETMVGQLQNQSSTVKMERILSGFINTTEDGDTYLAKAVDLMNELDTLTKIDKKVKALPVDDKYRVTATGLYKTFSKAYKGSVFSGYVAKKTAEIPIKIEGVEFKKLGLITGLSIDLRMENYNKFLKGYPKSRHKQAVKNMMAAVGDEVYVVLSRNSFKCDKAGNWENCIKIAERFIRDFSFDNRIDSVKELKDIMQQKSDYADLKFRASAVDFSEAREMFRHYLKKNPESFMKKNVRMEISRLNRKIDFKSKWDETYKFCSNKSIPLSQRIRDLKDYIERDYSGLFKAESAKLAAELKSEEKVARVKKNRRDKERLEKERLAKIQSEKDRKAKEAEAAHQQLLKKQQHEKRLKDESERMTRLLGESAARFMVNSDRTVKDTRAGLTWCIIDSGIEVGECMTYEKANAYVKNLRTGGYKDWRLPDAGELALIYNSKPYFPSSGSQWYWTAESIDEAMMGGGKAVIFYPDQKDVYKRVLLKFSNCGYVHAVRP